MLNHGNTLNFNNQNKNLVKKTTINSKERTRFYKLEILKEYENGKKKNRTLNSNIHKYNHESKQSVNIEYNDFNTERKEIEDEDECNEFILKMGSHTVSDDLFSKNISGSKNFIKLIIIFCILVNSEKIKEIFKDYNYKNKSWNKTFPIKSVEQEKRIKEAEELKKKLFSDLRIVRKQKEIQEKCKTTFHPKPQSHNQIKKINQYKQKQKEKRKNILKIKNKNKENKKYNVFFNNTQPRNISEETVIESKVTNWLSLSETLLQKIFEPKSVGFNSIKHSILKTIKENYLPEIMDDQIYFSQINKLETFTNESYNDIFSHEVINTSKEQLSEGEVKYDMI